MRTWELAGSRALLRAWRPAALLLATAALAGCSPVGMQTRAGYETATAMASMTPDVAGGRMPMAELPAAAGDILAVIQTDDSGIVNQRIVLRGDPGVSGENNITVKINDDPGPWDIDGPVGLPTKYMIAKELDENFPGVEMGMSQTFTRNSFGAFGYALGHPKPGVTCVYAWEFGVWKWSKLGEAPTGEPSMPIRPTSVRVRLCRSTLGEAEMLPMLRSLQVFPPGSRVPYSDPSYTVGETNGDALSAAGVHYFVVPGAKPARAARVRDDEAPPPRRRRVAHHARRHQRYVETEEERASVPDDGPMPGAVNVPMPGGGAPSAPAASTSNPLLAPLAAAPAVAPRAATNEMPLPSRAAPARAAPAAAPAPRSSSIPLPN